MFPILDKQKALNSPFKRFQRRGWLIGSLALLIGLGWSKAVRAEGSVDLISNGGDRPFLEFRTTLTGTIVRQSIIKVYAEAGETINLGSSATGIGQGDISYSAPDGTSGTCGPGVGQIPNRAAEVAGSGVGYTPCTITVGAGQTGIWQIGFVSPNPTSPTDPTPTPVNADWAPQPANVGYVAAWDVTVRNNAGTAIPGRAYANYLALNMGGNNQSLQSQTYIQTDLGYLYRINLNGIDPFGFIFFSNSKGFTDQPCPGGTPLFTSVSLVPTADNPNFTPPNICIPANADNPATGDITYKIFFNPPSPSLPTSAPLALSPPQSVAPTDPGNGTTWLRNPPPPIPSGFSFRFEGAEGTPNQAGPTLGGNFIFNVSGPGNYAITIDVNRDDVLGNDNDVVLQGPAIAGINTVPWNGQDGDGNPLPAGTTPYNSVLTFFVGDIHFPFLDPENNPNGLIIQRLNPTSLAVENSRVYYNDSQLTLIGNPSNPISALGGVDSTSGAHAFGNGTNTGFGNNNGIDTWTSLVDPLNLNGGILIQKADPSISKTVSANPVAVGGPISYTLTVTSNPPPDGDTYTNIQGARVTDTIPPEITGVSWTCTVPSGTGACGTASGTGNNIDLTVDLNVGATATITVNGTVSPTAAGTLNNTATVGRPSDVTDANPDNNTASAQTTISTNPIQPSGTKSIRLVTDSDNTGSVTTGDILEYTVIYRNTQPDVDITNFQATDTLDPSNLSFVSGSYSFTASGAGTTVAANSNYNGTTDANLTTQGTLGRGGGEIVVKYRAVVIARAGTEIRNQATATSTNGTVTPSVTDAAVIEQGDLPQVPDDGIEQGNLSGTGDDDPTVIVVADGGASRFSPIGRKSVRLATDTDNSGSVTTGDTLEYTVLYTNPRPRVDVTNFQATDTLDPSKLSFVTGSYSFTASGAGTTVAANPNYNGTTDINLTTPGTLGRRGGQILVKYRAVVIAPVGTEIRNQASATSTNGTVSPSISDAAVVESGDLPQAPDDGIDQGNLPNNTGDDDPTVIVVGTGGASGPPRLRLVKRITNVIRNGVPLSGVNFSSFVDDPNDDNDTAAGWSQLPGGAPIGVSRLGSETPLQSGDLVEYTIYFLSDGGQPTTNVQSCDAIPTGTTFIADSFGSNSGIVLNQSGTNTPQTNASDTDNGTFFSPLSPLTAPCADTNNPNGSVFLQLGDIPNTTPNNVGFVRFRVRIN